MFHSEKQNHVSNATKRSAIVLRDDDDDDHFTRPPTLSDTEPPEIVCRRAPPEPEKSVDDELVPRTVKSPTAPGFQLMMTSSSGTAAPPPWSAYRSAAARILAPASATAFQLAAFRGIYASQQQQQQQLRQTHQLPPHLRLSLFTDASPAPGMYVARPCVVLVYTRLISSSSSSLH